jgi:hypothetical protein
MNLSGLPSGKRNGDVWVETPITPNPYYVRLLKTPLSQQAKLVRAREHNGMLSAADANDALLKFDKNLINTLIATPTLEMGVDLPDLPTVIHRSVPPAAANYAQRAGRAGRGPKRAFVLTYCGLGSHDMTFFEEPSSMVAGEIVPPGMPDRNPFIIKRHLNGLILEVLGLSLPNSNSGLKVKYWHELVDVKELRNRLQDLTKNSKYRTEFLSPEKDVNWESVLVSRAEIKNKFIEEFIRELDIGLWSDLNSSQDLKIGELKAELRRHSSEFSDHFKKQIGAYRGLVNSYLSAMEQYSNYPTPDEASLFRQARRFAEMYLGARTNNLRDIPRPLSDMSATGFLPNFDFPGQVIRFKGLKDDPAKGLPEEDRMLQYDRGGTVALREFAPDQNVYGHGFVYQVQRYLENDLVENQAKGYGVCAEGCTTLSPPERDHCVDCSSAIVKIEASQNQSVLVPEIVQIREVHGRQVKAISDGANFRERHFFAEEARRIGAPAPDEHFELNTQSAVSMQLHLTKDHYLKTVFLILNNKSKSNSTKDKVFYRRRGSGTLFEVALERKKDGKEQGWEPFIPSIQIEGQGIVFSLPFYVASEAGLVSDSSPEQLQIFQTTLCTLIKRSAQRELRLGARSGNFDIQVQRIMEQRGEEFKEKTSSFVLLDREPGGSGVIPLIWECWDQILERVKETIKKDCCVSSCYRCLRSFDNQADHQLLDKRLFKVNGSTPIADFLLKKNFVKQDQSHLQKVDERSPAESILREILLGRFKDWTFNTQVERQKASGGLLTVPDFEVTKHGETNRYTIYVDGWRYHREPKYFYGDIRKRNELAFNAYRVITLPAGMVMDREKNSDLLNALITSNPSISKPYPTVDPNSIEFDPALIPALDPEVKDQLSFLGYHPDKCRLINFKSGQASLNSGDALAKFLFEYGEKLLKELRPFAVLNDDQILMRLNSEIILADQEMWRTFWIYHSILNVVGYRPIIIWIGDKPRRV